MNRIRPLRRSSRSADVQPQSRLPFGAESLEEAQRGPFRYTWLGPEAAAAAPLVAVLVFEPIPPGGVNTQQTTLSPDGLAPPTFPTVAIAKTTSKFPR